MNTLLRFFRSSAGIALVAGCLLPLAFAPVGLTGLAIISLACFKHCISRTTIKQAVINGFLFGLGQFGIGVSWLYISVHNYGNAAMPLATLITAGFIALMALYPSLMAAIYAALQQRLSMSAQVFAFASLWLLCEWARTTLFSGFPWLLLGYSQSEVTLARLAAFIGVFGVGFIVALMAGLLHQAWLLLRHKRASGYFLLAIIPALYLAADLLPRHPGTHLEGPGLKVTLLQGNQVDKWAPDAVWKSMDTYDEMTQRHWDSDLIVWPESAIAMPYDDLKNYFDTLAKKASQHQTGLLVGMPVRAGVDHYYNAMLGLGEAKGHYYKQHLVPFGEYLPIPWLAELIRWFNIPMSDMVPGDSRQRLLQAKSVKIAPFICYEIAYSDTLRAALPEAELLVTISDDAWFGHSFALAQQLQMAQVRSIQAGRYHVVLSNSGLSALIDPDGTILHSIPPFIQTSLTGKVYSMRGTSPWVRIGDNGVILSLLLLSVLIIIRGHQRRPASSAEKAPSQA